MSPAKCLAPRAAGCPSKVLSGRHSNGGPTNSKSTSFNFGGRENYRRRAIPCQAASTTSRSNEAGTLEAAR